MQLSLILQRIFSFLLLTATLTCIEAFDLPGFDPILSYLPACLHVPSAAPRLVVE